jgi:hypothetical protein
MSMPDLEISKAELDLLSQARGRISVTHLFQTKNRLIDLDQSVLPGLGMLCLLNKQFADSSQLESRKCTR